jgi:acyltransferase-like protein
LNQALGQAGSAQLQLEGCYVISRSNVSLSNLRAIVIIIVVAFHSALPYLVSTSPGPFPFDAAPYRWVAFPIVDQRRWFGFDLFCAWQDLSLMSLMFFLAGLFTPASLNRKGSLRYLSQRWWRIGLPFLLAAGILSPIAYFASYRVTAIDPAPAAFWQHWTALPMWPPGPAWFLWQLLALNMFAAGLHALAPQLGREMSRFAATFTDRPLAFFVVLVALSALAYVPLAMLFTPWDWASLGPFPLQLSRPLHYAVYFFAAFSIGSYGIDHGLLRCDGPFARYWPAWLATAIASSAMWGGLTSLTLSGWDTSPFAYRLAAALAFPPACAAGAFSLLAICLRLMRTRHRVLDSLSANAYSIYLLHYVFVVWLQYALLGFDLNAIEKAALVFAVALPLSWTASTGFWAASTGLMSLVSRHSDAVGRRASVDQLR